MTFTRALSTNNYGPAKFIVDGTTVANGTHSTIAAALTSASSGDTIFIRDGSYTENLTLKAGVNLCSFEGQGYTPNVTIIGNLTATFAGTCTISGVRLQTNSAALLTVSGSSATEVKICGCYINCTNNTGITYSSSSGSSTVQLYDCRGNIGTTGISLYAMSGAGTFALEQCVFNNSGATTTAANSSAGVTVLRYSKFDFPISSSSTGTLQIIHSEINTQGQNTTSVTTAGTSTGHVAEFSNFQSGSASAISVGSGTTMTVSMSVINSINTNNITGAGTLQYSTNVFTGSGSIGTVNTTTQTGQTTRYGIQRSTEQPAFSARNSAQDANVTGDGTVVTVDFDTEIFDQGSNFASDTFTAPYTGIYSLSTFVQTQGLTSAMTAMDFGIVTSNRTYNLNPQAPGKVFDANTNASYFQSCIADMDAADTATVSLTIFNGTKVADIGGGTSQTFFMGYLLC